MEESSSNLLKIVCPSAEALSVVVNNVQCAQCNASFRNESRLRFHDLKVHQRKNLDKTVKESIRYHCPESSCVYSCASDRYFTTMKYLKQHYLKVHAAKKFSCTQCDKSFSTESAKAAHIRVCGTKFTCNCSNIFNTYEALLTHAKRLNHPVDEKYKNSLKRASQKAMPVVLVQMVAQKKQPISILPYQENIQTTSQTSIASRTVDMATQTDELKKIKRIQSPSKSNKRRESRQTQTNTLSKEKRCRKTVETQTSPSVRELNKKSTRKQKVTAIKKDLRLSNTFTNDNLFPSSPLQLQHDVMQEFWDERNTSGTQTNPDEDLLDVFNDSGTQTGIISLYDLEDGLQLSFKNNGSSLTSLPYTRNYYSPTSVQISCSDPMLTEKTFNDRFSSIETQTEKPSIFDADENLPRVFAVSSNTETQTTEQFDNIEHLLYSNMFTQTCNDILPSELGLSDTQTQTAWPELEGTIDSEDARSQTTEDNKSDLSITACRSWLSIQTSHTETQTDLLSIFDEFQ